ncbi:MAG: Maf family protein, partial [Rhodospirillales bacterium]|nr:Maf family protein [Rhodospirillales bacterium]
MNSHNLILASASKVRAQMLSNAGLSFSVEVSSVDEDTIKNAAGDKSVEHITEELAIAKAQKVSAERSDALVIGADQILECEGQLFDKPEGRADGFTHLQSLSGKLHRLITAVAVVQDGQVLWQATDDVR